MYKIRFSPHQDRIYVVNKNMVLEAGTGLDTWLEQLGLWNVKLNYTWQVSNVQTHTKYLHRLSSIL